MNNIPTDSPVLQGIQPCLIDLVDNIDSEILYANEFSGIGPISMSAELKEIIDSDLGEVGPNILVQLEKKMRAVPGGPWYIDSRDGCIYIHNRNFKDIPLYTYSYKANSGELLDISFKTNYVTKRTSGGLLSGVDKDKNINTEVVFSNLDMTTLKGENWTKARQVARDAEVAARKTRIESGTYDVETRYGQPYISLDEAERLYKKGGMTLLNEKVNEARVAAYLSAMTKSELQREATPILEQVATDRGVTVSQFREELKEAMVGGNLESYLKTIFGNSIHTFNLKDSYFPTGGYPNTFQVYKQVDLFNYGLTISFDPKKYDIHHLGGRGGTSTSNFSTSSFVYADESSEYVVESQSSNAANYRDKAAMSALKSKFRNNIKILKDYGLTSSYTETNLRGGEGAKRRAYTYSHKLDILVESQSNIFKAPTWKLILNLYTRQISPEATAKDVESHVRSLLQANEAVTEKVLTCQMTCIGNPFLESSRILTLANLGNTWSGRWYIKTCKHSFSNNGYTCQLTLIENRLKVSSAAVSTSVKTDSPWDTKASAYDFLLNVTPEEARYYALEAESDSDKVEFLLRIITSRKSSNADYWNKYGIARVTSNTSSTSEGEDAGPEYSVDTKAPAISEDVRKLYEIPARAAVLNNNLTDLMKQIANENK